MTQTLRSALAVPFAWTSTGASDIKLTFASGTSPVDVSMPTATYRICLEPSASDYLRVLQTSMNAAMTSAGRTGVFTLSLDEYARVLMVCTETFSVATLSDAMKVLGFVAAPSSVTTATGGYGPKHLVTFTSRVSQGFVVREAMAGGETLAGIGYGVRTGIYREEDDVALSFIPPDPATRSALGLYQSPWAPLPTDTIGSHDGVWAVRDVIATAQGKTLHAALGTFQTLRTSTSERYDIVTLPTQDLAQPRRERVRTGWDAYFQWTTRMLRQSTATGTRA